MNEELNKKLAEWAEFRFDKVKDYGMWEDYKEHDVVYFPQRTSYNLLRELPNFSESLDACFKWLVPKLDIERINLYPATKDRWGCYFDDWYQDHNVAETPALALCLAIMFCNRETD